MRQLYCLLVLVLVAPDAFAQGNYLEHSVPEEFDLTESYPGILLVNEGPDEGYWVAGIQSGSGATIWGDSVAVCNGFTGNLIYVEDLGPEQSPGGEACDEDLPILDLTGRIVLIRRGACEFGAKALNVQESGAVGFLIYNDERVDAQDDTTLANMGAGAEGTQVTLPGLFIGRRLGQSLADQIAITGPLSVTLHARSHVDVDSDIDVMYTRPTFDVPGCGIAPELDTAAEPVPSSVAADAVAVYPNPAAGVVTVTLAPQRAGHVAIAVYDLLGREVARVHRGVVAAGVQGRFEFDTSALPAGLYLVRAAGASFASTQPLTVVR